MARQRDAITIRPSQRRQQSKWQRERSKQRAILFAGVIAVLFILAIPAYGYWSNFVVPPRNVVLRVDDTTYTLGFLTNYMKGLQELGAQPNLSVEPFRVLQLLEENELVRTGAPGRGARANTDEINEEVKSRIIGSSPELADVPPDQLDREFGESYNRYLAPVNLSEDEHRKLVQADLLRQKLTEILGQEVPTIGKQANVSWIIVSTENFEQVAEVSERLDAGEEFAVVAEDLSADRTTAVEGGVLGWVPELAYPPLDDTIFNLQPGETSGVINLGEITYFIKVTDVDDARTIEPEMRSRLKNVAYQQWIFQERGNHRIELCFGGGSAGGECDWQYDWLTKQVREAQTRQSQNAGSS